MASGRGMALGPVAARLDREADREPVPAVDGDHRDREIHELLVGEFEAGALAQLTGDARPGDRRQRLGPRQRRALTRRKERRLPPRAEQVDALLRLARGPGILRVHVEAVAAAVDLRG